MATEFLKVIRVTFGSGNQEKTGILVSGLGNPRQPGENLENENGNDFPG